MKMLSGTKGKEHLVNKSMKCREWQRTSCKPRLGAPCYRRAVCLLSE